MLKETENYPSARAVTFYDRRISQRDNKGKHEM